MALTTHPTALIVREPDDACNSVQEVLAANGWRCRQAYGLSEARPHLDGAERFLTILHTLRDDTVLAWFDHLDQRWPHRRPVLVVKQLNARNAIRIMKRGVLDLLTHPLEAEVIADAAQTAWNDHVVKLPLRPVRLTEAEQRVARLIMQGLSNKEVANQLHRSVRTIEDHRAHIMRKLGADNIVDFVKTALLLGMNR